MSYIEQENSIDKHENKPNSEVRVASNEYTDYSFDWNSNIAYSSISGLLHQRL